VYSPSFLPPRYRLVLHMNPMYYFVTLIRSTVYELQYPSAGVLGGAIASSVISVVVGAWLFQRLSARFAKEI
jgi:ABC-type polysaccharide/polyol phosphate export permease